MNEPRYSLRQEKNGTWTVLDIITRLPAASDGRDLTGLEHDDARDIAEALNKDHPGRPQEPAGLDSKIPSLVTGEEISTMVFVMKLPGCKVSSGGNKE